MSFNFSNKTGISNTSAMNTRLIPNRHFPVNLVAHLQEQAQTHPYDTALMTVSADKENLLEKRFDYQTLDQRVKATAATLQDRVKQGERALLLMENDEHYVIGFLACLYAGVIAVPVFPPESLREQHMTRLLAIAGDAQAQCIVTTRDSLSLLSDTGITHIPGIVVLTIDTVDNNRAQDWRISEPLGEDIAFLQYTSGSTAIPKGVMVSHHNLMTNVRVFEEGMSIGADDVFVSWLPLYHDMGLIGGLLQPIHRGVPVILMTPRFFIERPIRWLEVISRYRATVSGAPNFAFQLCADRIRNSQLQQLDLSCWRVAFCGAEPVRRNTMRAFTDRFRPAGFSSGTIYPCYGLAEATLFVTGGVRGEGMKAHEFSPESMAQGKAQLSDEGVPVVACGFPASNHVVKIVNPETLDSLSDGYVGEIWTSGDSLAQGYWQRPKETAEAFVNYDGVRWLRTGDLGFIHAQQLYIMGRCKDLIIIRGQNIYPQDIELSIEQDIEAVRKGRVAVFSVELEDGEGIGVAAEISRNMQKLIDVQTFVQVLSEAVSATCHESLSVVVLLNPGALPKTSSGKLQRSACRQGWLDRTLDAYAIYEHGHFIVGGSSKLLGHSQLNELECEVASIWKTVLNCIEIERNDHFFVIGGNSLKAIQAVAMISDRWRIAFTAQNLFQNPKLHECASEIKQLISMQKIQLDRINDDRRIPKCDRNRALLLSHGQQRLWFLWQLDPFSTAYHVQHAIRLTGNLNIQALRESFIDLIKRHESLRTIFCENANGSVEQVILASMPLQFELVDLPEMPELERDKRIHEETARLLSQPFDLTQGPLLRVAVIQFGHYEQILVMVMHHIVSDGTSMQILLDELAVCYQAHEHGKDADLAPLPIQYVDYAQWHQHWLQANEKDKQLVYWKNYLGTEETVLKLPVDRARKPVTSYRAARYSFDLPDTVVQSLRQMSLERDATLFMTLLAAFQALLFRLTGQTDIRIGVPVANRNRVETAMLIGFFVNTLVMRGRLQGRMPLDTLLRQIRDDAMNAQIHQDLPFEQLVEALHPRRDLRHSPLFQVTLNYLQLDYRPLQQRLGVCASSFPLPEPAGQLELRLEMIESPDGRIASHFIYAPDLFDGQTITRMASQYLCILQVLAAHPETPIGDIDILDDAEKQLLFKWRKQFPNTVNYPLVHRCFEEQAKKHPYAIAVIADQLQLNYCELNSKANRLAYRLISLGVKPEVRVGISVERDSVALIIGLLAILKAGGCYVPLDPDYPSDRLDYMIKNSGIRLILTQSQYHDKFVLSGLSIIQLDQIISEEGIQLNPVITLHQDNLAYVIYTSGSTGRPKGVSVSHGALAMHLSEIRHSYGVRPNDRELMFFSMNFDAAVEQWIIPLITGATLVLSSPDDLAGEGFAGLIEKHHITILHLTPAYLRMLLPLLKNNCDQVRTCIVGGEAWHAADVTAARACFGQARLVNAYGPTETVITPTAWINDADQVVVQQLNSELTPIGQPVGNRYAYVLDSEMNLATAGAMGELYIGGKGLARGYLDQPVLTSERFVADPFDSSGGRLYRTGDLVRWRNDGQLEYLGRTDQQIKLRGFRVELGEIKAQLLALEPVREAIVIAQENSNGAKLIAYVCMHDTAQRNEAMLKTALSAVLPDFMIPSQIIFLTTLPLTPNGKIDRHALPTPEQFDTFDYDKPASAMETKIADIWAGILQRKQIGLHNNFFDLGGHSLLLIQVKQRLEIELQVQVAIVDLFKFTTVASLAKYLSQGQTISPALPRHQQRAQRQRSTFLQRKQKLERLH